MVSGTGLAFAGNEVCTPNSCLGVLIGLYPILSYASNQSAVFSKWTVFGESENA